MNEIKFVRGTKLVGFDEADYAKDMEEMKNEFISICKSYKIPKKEILKLLTLARWIK